MDNTKICRIYGNVLLPTSEPDLSHQLHLAGPHTHAGDLSFMTRPDHLIGQRERRMVDDIRSVSAEVQFDALRKY